MEEMSRPVLQAVGHSAYAILIAGQRGGTTEQKRFLETMQLKRWGNPWDLFIPKKLCRRHGEGYRRVINSGETKYKTGLFTSLGIRQDGSQVPLEFSMVLLKDSTGAMPGSTSIMWDVTERLSQGTGSKTTTGIQ